MMVGMDSKTADTDIDFSMVWIFMTGCQRHVWVGVGEWVSIGWHFGQTWVLKEPHVGSSSTLA